MNYIRQIWSILKKKRINLYFYTMTMIALFEAIVILCIPAGDMNGTAVQRIFAYALATIFWVGILAEMVLNRLCSQERILLKKKEYRLDKFKNGRPGIICFFQNRKAKIVDIVFLIDVFMIIVLVLFKVQIEWLIIISVSVLFLSFNLHCLLNGRNYTYVDTIEIFKKEKEKDE